MESRLWIQTVLDERIELGSRGRADIPIDALAGLRQTVSRLEALDGLHGERTEIAGDDALRIDGGVLRKELLELLHGITRHAE